MSKGFAQGLGGKFAAPVAGFVFLSITACASIGCNLQGQLPGTGDGENQGSESTNGRVPAASGKVVGESCHSDDPNHVCLALRYVAFKDENGNAVLSQNDAVSNIRVINSIWKKCDIAFQIDDFTADAPQERSLNYQTESFEELDRVRRTYADETMLLVTTTGTWSGALGSNPANAWTSMPGGGPYGSVIEKPVAKYPYLIAHELGHYLNLLHVNDSHSLMNPTIYTYSTDITPSQCAAAKSAVETYWSKMKR